MAQAVGFSRALAAVRRTVAARRDAKRRARAVRIPPCSPCIVCRKNKKACNRRDYRLLWRRVRDSNPRDLSVYSISSAAPSTTRTTLRIYFHPCFLPKICSKIRWRENRRDGKKYSILRFSVLRNIKENQGDEIPSFCRNFESAPL